MCFSSGPTAPQTNPAFEYVDSAGTIVPMGTKGATKRRRVATEQPQSIMGDAWGASDAAGNSVGGGEDASGNGNAGSDAAGW
jgi:hypothetical protein